MSDDCGHRPRNETLTKRKDLERNKLAVEDGLPSIKLRWNSEGTEMTYEEFYEQTLLPLDAYQDWLTRPADAQKKILNIFSKNSQQKSLLEVAEGLSRGNTNPNLN